VNATKIVAVLMVAAGTAAAVVSGAASRDHDSVEAILYERPVDGETCGSIWSVSPGGGGPAPVIDRGHGDCDPAWAPDGRRFAFASDRGLDQVTRALFTADSTGRNPLQLTHPPQGYADFWPSWSPDGTRLAFERQFPSGPVTLRIVDADGSGDRLLAGGRRFDGTPSWSPDGRILFVSDRAERGPCPDCAALYVLRLSDGHVGRVTPLRYHSVTPSWSPDGTHIAWGRALRKGRRPALYVMRSNRTKIQKLDRVGFDPSWSPDSRSLFYSSAGGVFTIAANGKHKGRLTRDGGRRPSWRPSPAVP
jgi:Tol biopolymer transport system component